jgi:PAS domain S-box-containing protein
VKEIGCVCSRLCHFYGYVEPLSGFGPTNIEQVCRRNNLVEEVVVDRSGFRWNFVYAIEGKTIRIFSPHGEPSLLALPAYHPPVRGFLGVPIETGSRHYGLIYVADKLSGTEFCTDDVRFLITIAVKLAVAYENALRYLEIQERTATLEHEVAQRKQAEERFRLLIETAPTGILICDEKGRITEGNAQLQRMFGYTREELIGQAVEMLVPEQHRAGHVGHRTDFVNSPQTRPMGVGMELRGRRKDATTFPLEISLGPLVTGEGTWISSTVVDISERKKLEQQLQVSQRLESVGQLAAGIAHDFNNILTAITGNAKLALTDLPADHPVRQNLGEIQKASLRATQLVRQILTFGRQEAPKRQVIKLAPVVEEALKLLRAALRAGIEIRTHFEDGLPDVFADSTQIHQVVMNLATNAADAMAKQSVGVLEVRSEPVIVDADLARTTPELHDGSYVRLSIRDSGCGMEKATTARIFEPFYTTKPLGEGTGLGLSVVHGIMKTHGGAITVYSEVGKGTVFQLYLPAAEEAAKESQIEKTQEDFRGHGERVLYVDDEEPLVFLMSRMLTQLGYNVTGCTEPQKALETFRSGPEDFDVVVSDLSMPQMSGIDLAREILQTRPGMPILIASGYIRPEDNEGVRSLGLPDLLLKPDTVDELSNSLHNIFAKSKPSTDGEQSGPDSQPRHRAASTT